MATKLLSSNKPTTKYDNKGNFPLFSVPYKNNNGECPGFYRTFPKWIRI